MSEAQPLLKLEGVSKNYVVGDGLAPVRVLDGVTLEVGAGESVAIIGPSGSGKSTLLNIIGSLDQPTAGRVFLERIDLGTLDAASLAAIRNRQIGFIFQFHHLLPHCTALENVLIPTLARSPNPRQRVAADGTPNRPAENPTTRAERLLKRVGLGDRLHHRPAQLSGGERQRVAVVRALINHPRLLLADEPTGALDRASAEALGQLLVELNREEAVTLIVVTHALELARRMSRLMELKAGSLGPVESKLP